MTKHWYRLNPDEPNGLGGHRLAETSPGPGWIEGLPAKRNSMKRMKFSGGAICEMDDAEYYTMWKLPVVEKDADMAALIEAWKEMPAVFRTGTPEDIRTTIRGMIIANVDISEAEKTLLLSILPAMGKGLGIVRDLVLHMLDKKNE